MCSLTSTDNPLPKKPDVPTLPSVQTSKPPSKPPSPVPTSPPLSHNVAHGSPCSASEGGSS